MQLFARKPDPLLDRTKRLNLEIARLEKEIASLNTAAAPAPTPRLRSTAFGNVIRRPSMGGVPPGPVLPPRESRASRPARPGRPALTHPTIVPADPRDPHFNELGVRKYDLTTAWKRLRMHLRGPTSNNPRMVNYLAAGSIQGLRTLRYERRVARNRFLAFFVLLLVILWGLAFTWFRQQAR
ncbi:MAG: hypothetical protein EXS36_07065 [Pedosphaera sp.]|nr:hypothetical protein [Pedosphaera sp.]